MNTEQIQETANKLSHSAYNGEWIKSEYLTDYETGCFRVVDLIDGVIYKLARNKAYASYNQTEFTIYKKLPETVQEMTAEPIAISNDGSVLAMEYIPDSLQEAYAGDWHYSLDEFNKQIRLELEIAGWTKDEIIAATDDNHGKNIRVRANGELVWIDYAGCNDLSAVFSYCDYCDMEKDICDCDGEGNYE